MYRLQPDLFVRTITVKELDGPGDASWTLQVALPSLQIIHVTKSEGAPPNSENDFLQYQISSTKNSESGFSDEVVNNLLNAGGTQSLLEKFQVDVSKFLAASYELRQLPVLKML